MNSILLQHQWKYFWRGKGKDKTIATQIIIGFLLLYVLGVVCYLGFSFPRILETYAGKPKAVVAFCRFVLLYYTFDIVIRFLWQELPTIVLQPYLLQNIRRNQLISFLNIRSLFSFLNLLPLLLLIPYVVLGIGKQYGTTIEASFFVSILALCCGNHFFTLYIKRKTINSGWWLLAFIIFIVLIGTLNHFNVITIKNGSSYLFENMLKSPWLCIAPIIYAIVIYYLNTGLLRNDFYFEPSKNSKSDKLFQNNFLERFTSRNNLIDIEIKGILRNKRPRSMVLMSMILLAYGFITFRPKFLNEGNFFMPLLGALMVISAAAINYGQFLFAWQSNYFDGLLSNHLSIEDYINGKFNILIISATFNFIVASFYSLIDWHIFIILTSVYLFCIGVLPCVAIFVSLYHYKRLDVSESTSFNFQGIGFINYLFAFGFFAIICCIYAPFTYVNKPWLGILGIGIVGIINLLLRNWWIEILTTQFYKKKYKILEGFREN